MIALNPSIGALENIHRKWGWYLALGIALCVLGAFAILYSVTATLASMIVLGWILVFSGIVEAIHSFNVGTWSGRFMHLLAGVLEFVVGALAIAAPVPSAAALTLVLAAYLMVGGMFRCIAALSIRFPGHGWVALSGAIAFALGLAVAWRWPVSGLWFIGLCVGVDLILHGATWISFALAVHRVPLDEIRRDFDVDRIDAEWQTWPRTASARAAQETQKSGPAF